MGCEKSKAATSAHEESGKKAVPSHRQAGMAPGGWQPRSRKYQQLVTQPKVEQSEDERPESEQPDGKESGAKRMVRALEGDGGLLEMCRDVPGLQNGNLKEDQDNTNVMSSEKTSTAVVATIAGGAGSGLANSYGLQGVDLLSVTMPEPKNATHWFAPSLAQKLPGSKVILPLSHDCQSSVAEAFFIAEALRNHDARLQAAGICPDCCPTSPASILPFVFPGSLFADRVASAKPASHLCETPRLIRFACIPHCKRNVSADSDSEILTDLHESEEFR